MSRSAQLIAGSFDGGAERFFERLCVGLVRAGDEVLPIVRPEPGRVARLRSAGLAPEAARFGGPLDGFTRPFVASRLRAFAPRVTVAWMGRAASHAPPGPWVLVGRLGGEYDLKRFRRCEHLVANTPAIADWIAEQGMPRARIHLLPNFVPDQAGATPADLGLPAGSKLVLAVGRLHRHKAFDVLLAAMTRLPPECHAAIAGDGPERASLETLAARAGLGARVHFLGWRDDIASLMAAADVFVCPSRVEPLGNVVLEAFSAGRPVVAASSDGPRALIEAGRNGVLVPVDSGVALAAGIEGVLGNPAQAAAMAAAGRADFEARHGERAVLGAWRHFLDTIEKI